MPAQSANPFKAPERRKRKLRIAVDGPAGSGKSLLMLLMLRGLVGPDGMIAIIDTERRSIDNYLGIIGTERQPEGFHRVELTRFSVDDYCEKIDAAIEHGYGAIGIDSASHEWIGTGGILESVDKSASNDAYFNKAGWRKHTPEHMRFIDKITGVPAHVCVTIRSKVKYEIVTNEQGKKQPQKIGIEPVQREGFDYEFDILGSIDLAHTLTVTKARTLQLDGASMVNFLEGAVIPRPTMELGKQLREWCETPPGEYVAPAFSRAFMVGDKQIVTSGVTRDTYYSVGQLCQKVDKKHGATTYRQMLTAAGHTGVSTMTEPQALVFMRELEQRLDETKVSGEAAA